ncbi:FAD-dependent oxidoreductase [Agrococcus sp. DT81.2]|uniref:FAD-dependent oxidoreductase n=1 Tax=Agrococcus sp. DT81.2 TaxID=3393414 RepID=UPI003CE4B6AF
MQPSDLKNLTVAIVGAGYGGAAAAKALSLLGVNVTVYEQAREIREVGAGIGLRPATVDRFRRWGMFDAIAAATSASDAFEILTGEGHVIMKEEWPGIDDFDVPTKTHLVHRGDFIETLVAALPEGVLQVGRKVTGIEDRGDHATLTFTDGATVTADLVIAADGIKSAIREQLFTDAQPVFAGEHAYRIVIDADAAHGLVADDNLRMYIGHGTKVYFLPLRHRGQVSFDITTLHHDSAWAPTITRDELVATVQGFDERIVRITEELDMDALVNRACYDIDPVEQWHTDAVVLLGDAAHAMLHHQGQGANSAIMDAGAIADALQDAGSVKEALALYQSRRKPETDKLQAISRQGWSEDELSEVFPGQRPESQQAATR